MSNNPRVYLWVALLFLLWINYQAWMKDYGPGGSQVPAATATHTAPAPDLANNVPHAGGSATPAAAPAPAATAPGVPAAAPDTQAPVVRVTTDVLDVDISTRGGTITRVALVKYPLIKGQKEPVILQNDSPQTRYLLQTGLTGPAPGTFPDHLAVFAAPESHYVLGSSQELRVPLTWTDGQGLTFTKTFVFRKGEYAITLDQDLVNGSPQAVRVADYTQILRNDPRTKGSILDIESRTYHGPAYYDGSSYHKLNMGADSDDAHLSRDVTGGWVAGVQHLFVSAVVPPPGVPEHISMSVQGDQYLLTTTGPTRVVAPGKKASFPQTLYIGPMLQSQLDKVGSRLSLVTDYGYLTALAKPLFLLLEQVHKLTGNWGIAIVLVTFLLKLVFYPLQETAGRSMAKMKNLGPRIKSLQDTYKDDREKLGQAMMELYRREKINPVTGCLPTLIQIPVFMAFYWVLLYSVEMRQAPFLLWIRDLSSRDPFFVLPGVMALAMFLQYRMNPPSPDPAQAKVMMFMPFAMSFMFAFFPAGLVLYYVTNTLLSIAQQWNINRRLVASGHK